MPRNFSEASHLFGEGRPCKPRGDNENLKQKSFAKSFAHKGLSTVTTFPFPSAYRCYSATTISKLLPRWCLQKRNARTQRHSTKRVAVVGAGSSGIIAAKCAAYDEELHGFFLNIFSASPLMSSSVPDLVAGAPIS